MVQFSKLKPNSVIVIAGPTASGKSGLALDLAVRYNGVVINADSMQVYQGTPIISAVPNAEEKSLAEHRLYEIFPPSKNGTVVEWLALAVEEIRKVWAEGKLPIVVGGTGLYIDNLIKGTTPIPEPLSEVREQAMALLEQLGAEGLHKKLAEIDSESAQRLNPGDTTRVRRAYEIITQTGIPMAEWYKKPMVKKLPEAEFKVIKLIPGADELDERCYLRFDRMIDSGAVEEVCRLAELKLDRNLPAMKMLGVPELLEFVEGRLSLAEAISLGKLHTRQYAKRQRTWFNNKLGADIALQHCYTENSEDILTEIKNNFFKM